jgi:hypothetical protein
MASTPEGKIKQALDRMLRDRGVWFFSPQAGPYGVSGIPDRILIVCGTFVGVECKSDAKRPMTELQKLRRKQIEEAGGVYFLVYDEQTITSVRDYIDSRRGQESPGAEA